MAAEMSVAVLKPAENWSRCRYAAPVRPATGGRIATASSPPARDTSLLTAEAMPTLLAGAAASTVAVSGATLMARPNPKTTTAGRTSVT